jgi:hypothetical protein
MIVEIKSDAAAGLYLDLTKKCLTRSSSRKTAVPLSYMPQSSRDANAV